MTFLAQLRKDPVVTGYSVPTSGVDYKIWQKPQLVDIGHGSTRGGFATVHEDGNGMMS